MIIIDDQNVTVVTIGEQGPAGGGGGGGGSVDSVTLTQPAAGFTITSSGVAGTGAVSRTFALADDLAALEALSGTSTIYYRSAASTWTAVTIGASLSFSGGTLNLGGSPVIGTATATSINGNTITTGTGTLTLGAGKTLTASNTITLTATDGSTLAIGGGGTLGSAAYTSSSAYEVPLTFSTGLTRTTNTITVNTSQNISTLSNLTTDGLVTTSGGTGALSVTTLGSNVATMLGTFSSANIAAACTDETGSGSLVFGTSPTIATPSVSLTDSGTNTAPTVATFNHGSSGTPAAGFGQTILYTLKDSTTSGVTAASDAITWVVANHASRTARRVHSMYDTSAHEYMRAESTGTANGVAIGFLGASASEQLASPDIGTALTTFGFVSGTPTFAAANLTGTTLPSGIVSSSLTSVGTIATGVWQGTAVGVQYGGTGRSTSTTAYGLIAAGTTATGAHQTLAAGLTTQILVGGGTSALPAWGTDIPTAVTIGSAYIYRVGGTDVAVADGGTGLSSGTSGGVLYYSASGTLASSAALAANALVIGGGAGAAPATTTTGTGNLTALAANANATGGFPTTDGIATLSKKIIALAALPASADDTYEGTVITGRNAGATITIWQAVYLDSSGTWQLADANGASTYPAQGLAVAGYSSTNPATVLVFGVARHDAWTWTIGGAVYLSVTAGSLTQTAPASSGDKVQYIGVALTADSIFVNPSSTFLEIT